MPSISVERTIGKTKKAVLGGLIRYNNEKMGKQKHKRLAASLREGNKIVGGIVGEVWTAVLFIQLFWLGAGASREEFRNEADQGNRGRGPAYRRYSRLCRHDEFSGSGVLPQMRI